MRPSLLRRLALPLTVAALAAVPAVRLRAAEPAGAVPENGEGSLAETIQVTATRVPEDVEGVPASVTVISGDELRARGANDLQSALAVVAGVSVAPGGDAGPAGSVPELWGLREFDAFLLVVDGVPWGGAFNPALTTLDLTNVDRIEVLRGAAPVLYGATSFVGVIHVIHRAAGAPGRSASVWGGSYSSGGAAVTLPLSTGRFQQSLTVDGENQGFKDDRTGFERGHLLWRGSLPTANGLFHIDVDGNILKQDPASPHPREGRVLSPLVPLDANHNPRGAKIDEDRWHLTTGWDRTLSHGTWSSTLAFTHTQRDSLRGFLSDLSNDGPLNATGFEQDLTVDDVYFDTHLAFQPSQTVQVVAGFDHLYGKAKADSEDFDYFVRLDGSGAPSGDDPIRQEGFDMEDERNFSGLYLQTEWTPTHRLRFQLGARLNRTTEDREAGEESLVGEDPGDEEEDEGKVEKTVTRGSGIVGVSFLAAESSDSALWLYADWRNSYKPAALDFGPEAEAEILDPETAESWEAGVKGRHLGGRLEWEVSVFQMDFENLVVAQAVDGLPALVNAGAERFRGAELETELRLASDLLARVVYSRHDAKFQDFVQDFDGVPTQLEGNRLEMSAKDLAGAELVWFPARGWNGSVQAEYVGDRFLNKRNTALAPSYTTWSAGIGYRFTSWDLRLQGTNLSDERDPVAESELGDAQYYRLPARNVQLIWSARF
ncbi:MAG TPA: TonB-dependent receptor [Thermoanaerobaculia bacterium]|nr:TonB-dependent receptor [Thermoanaerobaculia bacterium]